jgi:hypothetical protein
MAARLKIGQLVAAQIVVFSFRVALCRDGQQARGCYGLAGQEAQMMDYEPIPESLPV